MYPLEKAAPGPKGVHMFNNTPLRVPFDCPLTWPPKVCQSRHLPGLDAIICFSLAALASKLDPKVNPGIGSSALHGF